MQPEDLVPIASAEAREQTGASTSAPEIADTTAPARVRGRRLRQRSALILQDWANVPSYLKDNEYIKKYYRVDYTFAQTLRSLFSIHNETLNVWTHLLGVFLFIALSIVTLASRPAPIKLAEDQLSGLESRLLDDVHTVWKYRRRFPFICWDCNDKMDEQLWSASEQIESMLLSKGRKAGVAALHEMQERSRGFGEAHIKDLLAFYRWLIQIKGKRSLKGMETALLKALVTMVDLQWPTKRWPIYVFTLGAVTCLATSTICHLFGSLGYKTMTNKIWKYDYAGIVILIVASFVPVIYYTFLCSPGTQAFYLSTTLLLGLFTLGVCLMKTFQHYKYRTFRACLFAGLGLWGIVPGVHAAIQFGSANAIQVAFALDILMGITYLAGATLYALRVPERWKPGAFDLYFNSHQIFHVFVVIAAFIHYCSVQILLRWRDTTGGCTIPFQDLVASQHLYNASAS